ncbi:hypothetical protein [Nocardia arthritidis]|uniref:Uncharacterized protein n=1 Tax=Nocardia arthritidis TaxID=228602 RepID=A0A6G9YHR8_9NOCA|nr:hypothetical protein [Nocardia arthritidis]QIS12700.1 hypothetical protein F5544_24225 [Nocardia arthritidis]
MLSNPSLARITLAAVSCAATTVLVGAGAGPAQAAAGSTTVTPAGHNITAVNQGPMTFSSGPVTGSCNTVSGTGAVPAAPGNANPSGPVSVPIQSISITDCTSNLTGVNIAITTSGTWTVSAQNGSPIVGSLVIPQAGMTIQVTGLTNCTTVVAPDGPFSASGTFTNGSPSTVAISNVEVPVKTTGDPLCPTESPTGTVSGTLAFNDTTDPTQNLTVGP